MKQSAGILLYKLENRELFVLLVHPGGPFFTKKDAGFWTIPKGEYEADEEAIVAAKREFFEETGQKVYGATIPLKPIKQKGGKLVQAWAAEGEFEISKLKSNTFELEWPPRSGKKQNFHEVDRAEWYKVAQALEKINTAQQAFILELDVLLRENKEI